MGSELTDIILEANSTPMVVSQSGLNSSWRNCITTELLPTPYSCKGTLIAYHYPFKQICEVHVYNNLFTTLLLGLFLPQRCLLSIINKIIWLRLIPNALSPPKGTFLQTRIFTNFLHIRGSQASTSSGKLKLSLNNSTLAFLLVPTINVQTTFSTHLGQSPNSKTLLNDLKWLYLQDRIKFCWHIRKI
mgnify:CR=1 FL=1